MQLTGQMGAIAQSELSAMKGWGFRVRAQGFSLEAVNLGKTHLWGNGLANTPCASRAVPVDAVIRRFCFKIQPRMVEVAV